MAKGRKTGGRRPGSVNKTTADVKAMIEGALSDLGGQVWLVKSAKKNPPAFMTLLGRVIPRDLNVNIELALSDRMRTLLERKP